MSRGIIIVCFAIAAVAAGLARAIGITLPRFALFNKEFGMIMFFQAFVSYFSSFPARLLTERPERYEGDVDGILDARLLEEKRDANQGLVLLTATVMSAMLILGHACCHDGEWTGVDGDDAWSVLRVIVGMSGEVIWFIGCCIVSFGDADMQKKSKAERQAMLVAHYPGWVVEGKPKGEQKHDK